MGIDCYLEWKDKQGYHFEAPYYLRESYHGEPYATPVLFKEAFAVNDGNEESYRCRVDSEELETRLPEALNLTAERHFKIYSHEGLESLKQSLQDIVDFVQEFKELEEIGEEPFIQVSY